MKISEWLPTGEELHRLKSIESSLLRRRRSGNLAGLLALLGAAVQIVATITEKDYGAKLAEIAYNFLTLRFDRLITLFDANKAAAVSWITLLALAVVYLLLRRTGLLLREAREPFKYTFWSEPFPFIKGTPEDSRCTLVGGDRFVLLHHDLMERLDRRIGRFSVLKEAAPDTDKSGGEPSPPSVQKSSSHIHVDGHIALREKEDGSCWGIHIRPRIRIGPEGSPATLGYPVFFPLGQGKKAQGSREPREMSAQHGKEPAIEVHLDASQYTQIVERVYSSVATEIYRRLDADVREKIRLFPTARLQILAIYREAEDFARSNTVDAYDRAIGFYRQALRHYQRIEIKLLGRWLVKFPWLIWRTEVCFQHDRARVVVGYAKCMVFRRELSAQSGRSRNPLYELPALLEESIQTLSQLQKHIAMEPRGTRIGRLLAYLRYPLDQWFTPLLLRPGEQVFDVQRQVLFDLYLASALVQRALGCNERSLKSLENAAATAPDRTSEEPLYILLKGLTEPLQDKAIVHCRQAAELAPDFQMAQWYLGKTLERIFRQLDELIPERAQPVLQAYEAVNTLNYGNIGALYARGYLLWLVSDFERARACLEAGQQVKVVSSETFTGELSYGLARIAAETGRFEDCRMLYLEGITAEPELGIHYPGRTSRTLGAEFDNMGDSMLKRYEQYKKRVEDLMRADDNLKSKPRGGKKPRPVSDQTLRVVQGFVLNDYGNACLRHFHQLGDQVSLEQAIVAYGKAVAMNPLDARPRFNLHNAYSWNGEDDKADACVEQAGQLSPGWTSLVISAAVGRGRKHAVALRREEARLRTIEADLAIAADAERKWLELDRDEALAAIAEWERKLSQARALAFDKIRETSRFGDILAAEDSCILEQARWLTAIPWNKLEEREVELQIRLAELLAIRATAEDLEAAEMLWSRLFEMLPEDHEVVSGLWDVTRQGCKARWAFGVIRRLGYGAASQEIRQFAARSWRELDERKIDLLIQLAELFHSKRKYDREAAVLLTQLFGMTPEWTELARGLSAWKTQWKNRRSQFIAELNSPALACSRMLCRGAKRQYRQIVLGWLRSETQTFLAHWWIDEFAQRPSSSVRRQTEDIKREFFGDVRSHLRKELEGWVYFRKGDYAEAEKSFLDAVKDKPEEPDYRYRLWLCRERLQDWYGAMTAYQEARRLEPDTLLYRTRLGAVYNRIGYSHWQNGAYTDAADTYGEAVQQVPDEAVNYRNLALALERAELPDPQIAMEKACQAIRQAVSLAPTNLDYRQALRRMETRQSAYLCYGSARIMKFYTAVTPLTVEYGAGLESFIDAIGVEDLRSRYQELQQRLWGCFGVEVPFARWRRGAGLPRDEYLVMFNEVPLLPLGTVEPERKFCPDPPWDTRHQTLRTVWQADVHRDPVTGRQEYRPDKPARDPLTGNEGVWIDEHALEPQRLKELGLFDALAFVLRHLEMIIRNRLHHFLTRDDVVDRLRQSRQDRVRAIATSPEQIDSLTDMLKAMLAERMPIEPFDELCWHFLMRPKDGYIQETIEEIRIAEEIRPGLWGNTEGFLQVPVSPSIEMRVHENLRDTGKTLVLTVDVQSRKQLLAAVAADLKDVPRPVLVVEKPRVRVFLRRLIEVDFPEVPVLAKRECRREP